MAASVAYSGGSATGEPPGSSGRGKEATEGCRPDTEATRRLPPRDQARGKVRLNPRPTGGKGRPGRHRRTSDPSPLPGGVPHPFSDPVGDEFSFHLRDRGENREHEPPSGRGRIQLRLGERGEPDPDVIEILHSGKGMKS